MSVLSNLPKYKKAIAGLIAPGVVLFVADVTADSQLPSSGEWLLIGTACLATFFGVAFAPKNQPSD